jgi:hypothetical protein
MEMVSKDFQSLARTTGISTFALDKLHVNLANWKGQP